MRSFSKITNVYVWETVEAEEKYLNEVPKIKLLLLFLPFYV